MTRLRAYLDCNATCPVRPAAVEAAVNALRACGNPSSIHGEGRAARKIVEDARGHVAALAKVRPAQVIFTSGATEAANQILSGCKDQTVFALACEHPCILESAPHAKLVPVLSSGAADLAALEAMLATDGPALIAAQLVNSETGMIQPVADIAALAMRHGAKLLCDAVQAAGRMALDFKTLGCDFMLLSAHKFGGPAGVGAIVFREGLQLPKLIHGGGQEKRQRAGTENISGIAGFGAAAQAAMTDVDDFKTRTGGFQKRLEDGLRAMAPRAVVVAADAPRVTNTTSVILPGAWAETQLMAMDLAGVAVSSGSACSSGTLKASHVLTAMGYSPEDARAVLRFSTGWATTGADIDAALAAYASMAARLN